MLKAIAAAALLILLLPGLCAAEGGCTVFLGDSRTREMELDDLFPGAGYINMGVGADTALGVMNRLDGVLARKPARVLLMIGVNDLSAGVPIAEIIKSCDEIIARLTRSGARVFVGSVLPVDMDIISLYSDYSVDNEDIKLLNKELAVLAQAHECDFIDLYDVFEDCGALCAAYTCDGLHLSQEGNRALASEISRYLD